MGRPPKTGEKMDVDLRIPVTPSQREVVRQAVALQGMEIAAWARQILMASAQSTIAGDTKKQGKRKLKVGKLRRAN